MQLKLMCKICKQICKQICRICKQYAGFDDVMITLYCRQYAKYAKKICTRGYAKYVNVTVIFNMQNMHSHFADDDVVCVITSAIEDNYILIEQLAFQSAVSHRPTSLGRAAAAELRRSNGAHRAFLPSRRRLAACRGRGSSHPRLVAAAVGQRRSSGSSAASTIRHSGGTCAWDPDGSRIRGS